MIPNSVIDILRLGEKFSSPHLTSKQNTIFQIVKDVESNMNFIEGEENRDILRHRILNAAKSYFNNPNNNIISQNDRIFAQKIVETKQFLKTNKQLLVSHADKDNITVVLN